jgi:DNA-binding IclR family transcriptional regulator
VSATGHPLAAFAISMPLKRYQEMDRADIASLAIAASRRVSSELRAHDLAE